MTDDQWVLLVDPVWQVSAGFGAGSGLGADSDSGSGSAARSDLGPAAGSGPATRSASATDSGPATGSVSAASPASASGSPRDGAAVATPPLTAVVGGWLAREDGSVGRFEANPAYEPSGPGSPTDPLDAALRLAAREEADFDQVAAVLRESAFSVALDVDQEPLIAPSPDNVPCLLVTTAPAHRTRVRAAGWLPASAADLVPLLSAREGTDLLLNPGAPGCTRLLADTVRAAVSRID
ncbi:type VII secretion system-associated protein [Amycolatopsis sp. NBC_00345]|uniref:type VII secretion system-associated protein n=1 Tax=Amycolatopsis sp. NBC_00345 TaxID=2975955 RepID=UPI002E2702DB